MKQCSYNYIYCKNIFFNLSVMSFRCIQLLITSASLVTWQDNCVHLLRRQVFNFLSRITTLQSEIIYRVEWEISILIKDGLYLPLFHSFGHFYKHKDHPGCLLCMQIIRHALCKFWFSGSGLESRNLLLSSTPGVPDLQGTLGNIAKMIT